MKNITLDTLTNKEKAKRIYDWILKLESGTVKQTTGALCDLKDKSYSYCCLGVFQNMNKDVIEPLVCPVDIDWAISYDTFREYLLSEGELHYKVEEAFGFNDSCGGADGEDPTSLAELNDNGKSFKEIAEYIRLNYRDLFAKKICRELSKLLKNGK